MVCSLRHFPHLIHGYSIHVQEKRLPYSVFLPKDEPVYSFENYVRLRIIDFNKTYELVKRNIALTQEIIYHQHNKTISQKLSVIGNVIFIKVHEKDKLLPRFAGTNRDFSYEHGNELKVKHITS